MQKLAVLISGSGSNLGAIIRAEEEGTLTHGRPVLVISNRESAYGLVRAAEAGIDRLVIKKKDYSDGAAYEQALIEAIDGHSCDLVILAGFLDILGETFTGHYKDRILNIHPSLIPAFAGPGFYGLKVHRAAIEAGVKLSGATVHLVNEVCDGGKILAQEAVPVLEGDTAESLQKRILEEVEHSLYPRVIEAYCQKLEREAVCE